MRLWLFRLYINCINLISKFYLASVFILVCCLAYRVLWHGNLLGVLRGGLTGLPHSSHQDKTQAKTQSGEAIHLKNTDTYIALFTSVESQFEERNLSHAFLTCFFPLSIFHPWIVSPLQSSMNRMAIQALEKMETRKFKAKVKGQRETSCGASDSLSSSSTSDCAICLEKYIDGEVIIFRKCQSFGVYIFWFQKSTFRFPKS